MSDIVERLRASYEFNGVEMLETAADTIIRLTAENDLLANDRDGYVQLLTDQNTRLTAGSERLRAGNRDLQLWFDDLKIEYDKLRAALLKIRRGSVWNCDIPAFIAAALAEEKKDDR